MVTVTGVTEVFERARDEHRGVTVGYLPAGFPSFGGCIAALTAMVAAGVEVVEIGLPHPDPIMEAPAIQAAIGQVLRAGARVRDALRTVEAVASTGAVVLLTAYWPPVERYGVSAFARDLVAAGATGLVTPDLLPEHAGPWLEASDHYRLDRVFRILPACTDTRIAATVEVCRGLVHATAPVHTAGGHRGSHRMAELVARVRARADVAVGVDQDVGDRVQASNVAGFADAVVVSAAFVRRLWDAPDEATGVSRVSALAVDVVAGVRCPRRD